MKCPICVKLELKSTLHGGDYGMSTLVNYFPYHDEDGNYHNHDRNTTTYDYNCSQGHEFRISGHGSCPSYPEHCDFEKTEEIRVFKPENFEL